MKTGLSLYLDLVRFLAAIAVLMTHLAYTELSGDNLANWRLIGNDAVMVFFVLSGFVIAYVSETKERTFREYNISRLARLWSVAVPALILTIFFDQAGRPLNPEAYAAWWYEDERPFLRVAASLTFTNEIWFNSIRPFSNGPYWSLGYEFWYYAIFGAFAFLGGWKRYALVAGLALVAGPKILLLFPVWMLGVATYYVTKRTNLSVLAGALLFGGSLIAYVAYRAVGAPELLLEATSQLLGEGLVRYLQFSNEFVSSFLIGLMVAAHFLGAHAISRNLSVSSGGWMRAIRWAAQSTFTIYLLHYPLLRFIGATVEYNEQSPVAVALVFFTVAATCMVVGSRIENTKGVWRQWLDLVVPSSRNRTMEPVPPSKP